MLMFMQDAAEIATAVVNSMSKVGDVLANSMEVGSPPVTISLPKLAMDVRKQTSKSLVEDKIETNIGGCKIDGVLAVDDGRCVKAQVSGLQNVTGNLSITFCRLSIVLQSVVLKITLKCEVFDNNICCLLI